MGQYSVELLSLQTQKNDEQYFIFLYLSIYSISRIHSSTYRRLFITLTGYCLATLQMYSISELERSESRK